jgi:hypothetical protein
MSDSDKNFDKLVEDNRRQFPEARRTLLGKLIRAENNIKANSREYRALDRSLEKSFSDDARVEKLVEKIKEKQGILNWIKNYINLIDVIETEEDAKKLADFLDDMRRKKESQRENHAKSEIIDELNKK